MVSEKKTSRVDSNRSKDLEAAIKEFSVPVQDLLGKQTRWVLAEPEQVESYLIYAAKKEISRWGLDGYLILAQGPRLGHQQIALVQKLVFNPESYYSGVPIYRRFPHVPEFALRWTREKEILDLMIDLHNPGWNFYCGHERYSDWNWVGDELASLAKSLFPEYASPNRKGIWRKNVIKGLIIQRAG
ncbi:MAG: hypothetical protein SXV54_21655 [Chloroflexota bacterium]|nr:hypothetical protein [Chloroflexota bacterium]